MVFVFLFLISLSIMFSGPIHPVAKGKMFSFSQPSTIPLCKCSIVVLSTYLLMDNIFHNLAIVNNAAMNIGVLMFFQISI